MFQGKKCWASMPLKYSIMKELHTVREISLVQPLAALEMLLFVGIYQKELLNLLVKNACFLYDIIIEIMIFAIKIETSPS